MADNNSTVQFKADISQLKSAMQQAQRQVKLANSEFKAASAGMDDWSDSAEGLRAKLKQLDATLKSQKTQLSLLETEYTKTVEVYGENSAAADRVKISINNMKASIAKTESQIESYSGELTDCENGTGRFADQVDDLDSSVENAGDGFTVFKGILSDLVSNVIQSAISEIKELASEVIEVGSSFESSMANVGALSGATEEELQLLSDTAKEFGSNTKFSATEAADALSYMALAGWDAQTSCDALGGVLDLAASSGMDLAEASDMVTDYLSAFGLSAEDSAHFADLLSYAQSNANTTAEGLGEAYKNCAANMNAAGQDIETTTALLSSMANQGLKGSEAGTALAAVMRDMTSKMKDGAIQIGETSVEVQDAQGNFRDLTDILKDVEDATEGMGDAEKSSALMATFTSDSIKGLNLILNAGVDSTADFEDALRECDGTAKDMAATMNDTLSGDITALNSKLEGIKITIYESMAPALREAVASISEVLDTVDWEEKGKQLGEITVKAVDFFSKVLANADGVKDVLVAVGTTLGTAFVVSKVLTFATAISSLYTTFKALKTATDVATTSQLLLNAAQAATPIGLVTAAVAGLAAGLIYFASKSDDAKEKTKALTDYEEEQIAKVDALREAYEEMADTRDKNVDAIETEYGYYETLADELDGLVDANGTVKEGYEDRVNFILTTLNDAVGTEMELVDGVIQNYQEEKDAIYDLIEAKKAQAVLSANEELYTAAIQNSNEALQDYITTQGIYNQNVSDMEAAQNAYNNIMSMSAEEYAKLNDLEWDMASASQQLANDQDTLANELLTAKAAVGQSRVAMETAKTTYEGYQATIQNYEGLSSAIISGDTAKISQALLNMEYDFQTAETSTKKSLENQVTNYETNLAALEAAIEAGTPGVTQEMVDQAQAMVDAAKAELDKLPAEATESANAGASAYATTLGSDANVSNVLSNSAKLRDAANQGVTPDGGEKTAGENFGMGYVNGLGIHAPTIRSTAMGLGSDAVDALNKGQDSNSPSRATTTSGENFGQGFINGMGNKESSIWQKAWNLAKTAIDALKAGQQEGSPSKLTRQSGKFFGEGYEEGIEETKRNIQKGAENIAVAAIDSLRKTQKEGSPSKVTYESGVNFVKGYINGIASMSKDLQSTVKNITNVALREILKLNNYNFSDNAANVAEKLAADLSDKTEYLINKMTYQNTAELAKYDDKISSLEAKKAKKIAEYDAKINNVEFEDIKKLYRDEKDRVTGMYDEHITILKNAKEAYQSASSEMITQFSNTMSAYSTKAQTLINDTINGISDKYQGKYDELINKQDALISKLKSAGDLFDISGAGIMTVNDIKTQTKQIKDYTAKLQKIKSKVSSDLFDQIASYDMKEGGAFLDRLLALSDADLKAYSKAYDEKMNVAQKLSENVYSKDFKKVASDYEKEMDSAFSSLPKQLEVLGDQSMKGFISGLTKNTDYMTDEIKTYIKAMVDVFRDELKIHSPSRVMEMIGDYTGEGFVEGLKNTVNNVKKAANNIVDAAARPLEGVTSDLGAVKASIGNTSAGTVNNTTSTIVNNYNMTQNNTSPKSLSALDTFQARRAQLALLKAMT